MSVVSGRISAREGTNHFQSSGGSAANWRAPNQAMINAPPYPMNWTRSEAWSLPTVVSRNRGTCPNTAAKHTARIIATPYSITHFFAFIMNLPLPCKDALTEPRQSIASLSFCQLINELGDRETECETAGTVSQAIDKWSRTS